MLILPNRILSRFLVGCVSLLKQKYYLIVTSFLFITILLAILILLFCYFNLLCFKKAKRLMVAFCLVVTTLWLLGVTTGAEAVPKRLPPPWVPIMTKTHIMENTCNFLTWLTIFSRRKKTCVTNAQINLNGAEKRGWFNFKKSAIKSVSFWNLRSEGRFGTQGNSDPKTMFF